MTTRTLTIRIVTVFATAALLSVGTSARAATADDTVVAFDPTSLPATVPAAAAAHRIVGIDANIVNGLSVSGAGGGTVTLTTRGQKARTMAQKPGSPTVFRQLTAGVTYTVSIDGIKVGTGVPVATVGPAYGLTVSTTGTDDEVLLRWSQKPAKGQGTLITYDVVATPNAVIGRTSESESAIVAGTTTSTVTTMALNPNVKYTISVTPRNSASTGRPTAATMTRTLAEMSNTTPPPAPPAPAPAPAPAPTPVAATQTIYVCPSTHTETVNGLCEKAIPYTYDTKPYTYHWGVVGSHAAPDAYAADMARSTGTYCPWGGTFDGTGLCVGATYHSVEDFGEVKDNPPVGYTDNGTVWSRKNSAPAGYADNGAQWIQTVAKISQVVPA